MKITGKGILINSGHSSRTNGAMSVNGIVSEYDLNVLQAEYIKKALTAAKISCRVINQKETGSLTLTGRQAKGYDAFISLHHNATTGAQYTCYLLGDVMSGSSKELAQIISAKIAYALNIKNAGYLERKVSITNAACKVCPCVILVESFFIDGFSELALAKDWSIKAAKAISDSIIAYFKE
jgi:N-acetylmuramoyl-L-alanine amidase